MYSSFKLAKKYLYYYYHALNGKGHGMHSPFVFDFILHVLNNKSRMELPEEIEDLRRQLKKDKRMVAIHDLGAGSRMGLSGQKTLSELAGTALKPEKYASLFFRLARHYRPCSIIELGTSLGLTTAYISKGNPSAEIITIEGNPSVASLAGSHFEKLNCSNIKLLQGNFDTVLPQVLSGLSKVDLVFIDGNHRYEATIDYFMQLLPLCHNDTILIFDDIHWSSGMEKAWEEIKLHQDVACTLDIFFLGFVFFRKEFKIKQNFSIRY